MLAPLLVNAAEITTFREGREDYIMVRFFFQQKIPPTVQEKSFLPPIEFIPATTIIMSRGSYKSVMKKFAGFVARQEEPIKEEEK